MELRICDLATVFLRNIVGSAAFILGSLNFVASAETPVERGSYLVNSIGACGNCQARDSAANRTPDLTGGLRDQRSPDQGLGKRSEQDANNAITKGVRPDGAKLAGPMAFSMYPR